MKNYWSDLSNTHHAECDAEVAVTWKPVKHNQGKDATALRNRLVHQGTYLAYANVEFLCEAVLP